MSEIIIFDEHTLSERGTSNATFDYAEAMEAHAGIRAVMMHDLRRDWVEGAVRRWSARFETIGYNSEAGRADLVRRIQPKLYYYQRGQIDDIRLLPDVKVAVHSVFDHFPVPQADRNAYISDWLAHHMTGGKAPAVPYIVTMPPAERDMRAAWGIPAGAVVLGRHGGRDTFDIPFAKRAVARAVQERQDLWFLFVNTDRFIDHPRVRFLDPIFDLVEKADFIATCDAMIHARERGESFGLAMAEFLLLDRPVLCWAGGRDRNHLVLQPNPHHLYRTEGELMRLLRRIGPAPRDGKAAAAMAPYAPDRIAARFSDVFLTGPRVALEGKTAAGNLRRRVLNARSLAMNRAWYAASRIGL
ncbi:hypothetical protein PQ455_12100 [Sphingomonas naphthae]|uniref:Glycosyltransferase family 1 protein n=1 Tax=Sphingomonas naphthae TaxID=1813468 RepID=A0ABY7TGN2_9SPHN|nr:hypothetical protein [Sphingomonas naphthae]WCT72378.1 hypothetical protein PQ455_12100 [Sphingomonas naphthae]